jgi:hypothetical protein
MRYMMLVYSTATEQLTEEEAAHISNGHRKVMEEASAKGILVGAEPLAPVTTATTVRHRDGDGETLVIDGPFAETKEHLAGYYIMNCENLDEAIEWAAKIPTACYGVQGSIEIRPMRFQPQAAAPANG